MRKTIGTISASMMCTDLVHLKNTIKLFELYNVEYLHIDVMDGDFVPNFGLGVDYIRGLRELTSIPFDIHLMIKRPDEKLEWFGIKPDDNVIIHFESTVHVQRTLEKVHRYNCTVMLAINPATPIYSVEESLEYIDGICILTVNPGFAGQRIVSSCISKTERMRNYLNEAGLVDMLIEVDGNISFDNAAILRQYGADIFVAGSSSIFSGGYMETEQHIKRYREIIS